MDVGFSKSAAISARTRFCASVGLNGRMRLTASRTRDSRTRKEMPGCRSTSFLCNARLSW